MWSCKCCWVQSSWVEQSAAVLGLHCQHNCYRKSKIWADIKECRGCVKGVALKMLVFLSSSCLITWTLAPSIHSRVWTEESCTDDMLSTTGGKAESGLKQADVSAVGCCSPYAPPPYTLSLLCHLYITIPLPAFAAHYSQLSTNPRWCGRSLV